MTKTTLRIKKRVPAANPVFRDPLNFNDPHYARAAARILERMTGETCMVLSLAVGYHKIIRETSTGKRVKG